jgi:hypothetical protein
LFKNDGAEALFAALMKLPRAQQFEVVDRAQRLLYLAAGERRASNQREREAIRGLREIHEFLGDAPSMRRYEEMRSEHPECAWPPARSVKRWLGVPSWSAALQCAHLPVARADDDPPEVELGAKFGPGELCAALLACANDLGRLPGFNDYYSWAHRADVRKQFLRLPLSQAPFSRIFRTGRRWSQRGCCGTKVTQSSTAATVCTRGRTTPTS